MVNTKVSVSIDVEDFYDGMSVLGSPVRGGRRQGDQLASLVEDLRTLPSAPKVTLFVVGAYAGELADGLSACAGAGHEIASHGPDHGRLPDGGLVEWLRRGRDMLEQLLQVPVVGFRSPRFDVPPAGLPAYRGALAEAGYRYVSDTSRLGDSSAVVELPVLDWRGVRVGGGSYQRLLPPGIVDRAVIRSPSTAVLYYHSYDFDGSVPGIAAVRSMALAKQIVGRARVRREFLRLVRRFGSRTCADVAAEVDVTG